MEELLGSTASVIMVKDSFNKKPLYAFLNMLDHLLQQHRFFERGPKGFTLTESPATRVYLSLTQAQLGVLMEVTNGNSG